MPRFSTVLLLIGAVDVSRAAAIEPLPTTDQNPLVQIYGLPPPAAAGLADAGQWHSQWSLNISNTLNIQTTDNESLIIDGEMYQFNVSAGYGLSDDWGLRLHLPLIAHRGGFLDRPIDRFHKAFGLPRGQRPATGNDQLNHVYARNGHERLRLQESVFAAGDLQIMLGRELLQSGDSNVSVWGDLKLPTGDSDKLTGSGAVDASVWLATDRHLSKDWQYYARLGLLAPGAADNLSDLQHDTVWFGNAGLQWRAWQDTTLKLQLDAHTGFYQQSGLRLLGDVVRISGGIEWNILPNARVEIGLSEDIKSDASPDITFIATLRLLH